MYLTKHPNPEKARAAQRKGVNRRQPPEGARWCIRCERKWAQDSQTRMCRACGRETGTFGISRSSREAGDKRLATKAERLAQLEHAEPRPSRKGQVVEYHGRLFEIVWDGT